MKMLLAAMALGGLTVGGATFVYSNHGNATSLSLGDNANGVLSLADGTPWPYGLQYGLTRNGWWRMNFANLDGGDAFAFSNNSAADGFAHFWVQNGIHIGHGAGGWPTPGPLVTSSASAPTNACTEGDRVLNLSPSTKPFDGWICVASGVWKTYGAIFTP